MFTRTNLLAAAMLGLGTLLGYAAAWGKLPGPSGGRAVAADGRNPPPAASNFAPPANVLFAQAGGGGQTPKPGNPRGATTGPTDAPGYDHPNQYLFTKPTEIAPNMEPVIVHPKQVDEAKAK
jgi:hypothetical protein